MTAKPDAHIFTGEPAPEARIELDAIASNWRTLSNMAPAAATGAVLKADAYGLGMEPIARRLLRAGCETFFTAYLGEALALRRIVGPEPAIFAFHGPTERTARAFAETHIIPVINSLEQAAIWRELRAPAALNFDTGMNRLGIRPWQANDAKALLDDSTIVLLMSHLACSDQPEYGMNALQRDLFVELADQWPEVPRSLSATGGICLGQDYCFELTRPGIGLYGGFISENFRSECVVTLETPLLNVFTTNEDDPIIARQAIGYGATAKLAPGTRIGVMSLGYADGALRALSNSGTVIVGDTPCPIVGRVSMDLIAVDITKAPTSISAGELVEVFGPRLDIERQADSAATISYELLTSIGARVKRNYVGSTA